MDQEQCVFFQEHQDLVRIEYQNGILTILKKGVCLFTMGAVKVRIFILEELIKFCFEGNGNNFDSEKACQESCPSEFLQADICKIEKEVGPCRDLVERFYFDSQMGTCRLFQTK